MKATWVESSVTRVRCASRWFQCRVRTSVVVETVSVTAGEMVLVVDGAEHPVVAGQTATFDADHTHTYRGSGTGPCHLIMTVHLPPGPA